MLIILPTARRTNKHRYPWLNGARLAGRPLSSFLSSALPWIRSLLTGSPAVDSIRSTSSKDARIRLTSRCRVDLWRIRAARLIRRGEACNKFSFLFQRGGATVRDAEVDPSPFLSLYAFTKCDEAKRSQVASSLPHVYERYLLHRAARVNIALV